MTDRQSTHAAAQQRGQAAPPSAPVGVEEMQRRLDREESDHGRTIDQRDAAEDALGRMFQAVTGRTAEWSSAWGYVDAIEEVEEHVATLAAERDQLAAALEAARRNAGMLAPPEGYALISVEVLRAWGKLDELRECCRYPKHATSQPEAQGGGKAAPPSAPVGVGGKMAEVVRFLMGEAPLEGRWFDEPGDPHVGGAYWWRKHLTDALAQQPAAVDGSDAQAAEIEALRAEVAEWKRVAAARGEAEARAERLAEALRHQRWCRTCAEDGWESCEEGRKNDALLREQEEGK